MGLLAMLQAYVVPWMCREVGGRRFSRASCGGRPAPLRLLNRLLLSIETHALCGALGVLRHAGLLPAQHAARLARKYVLRSPTRTRWCAGGPSYYPRARSSCCAPRGLLVAAARRAVDRGSAVDFWAARRLHPLEMGSTAVGLRAQPALLAQPAGRLPLTVACWAIAVALVLTVSVVPPPGGRPRCGRAPRSRRSDFLAYKLLAARPRPAGIALAAAR